MPDPTPDRQPEPCVRMTLERSFSGTVVNVCAKCGACVPTVADEDADDTPRKVHDAFHDSLKVPDGT